MTSTSDRSSAPTERTLEATYRAEWGRLLSLLVLCCHPALPSESRSALALRVVIGTSTEQIARLFLVSTATMAARLTRAKKKIVGAGIALGAPADDERRSRLDEAIYLAFTAGYSPGAGVELLRSDLAGEAVRLATVWPRSPTSRSPADSRWTRCNRSRAPMNAWARSAKPQEPIW